MQDANTAYQGNIREMVEESLARGEQVSLRVSGDSMAPFLRIGDWIMVRSVFQHMLSLGDIIMISQGSELVTHRLIVLKVGSWKTKGDNAVFSDPPVPERAILGRVVAFVRQGRTYSLETRKWRTINRCLGWLGRCQAGVSELGRRVINRPVGSEDNHPNAWGGRVVLLPFVLLEKMLISLGQRLD